MSQSFKMKVNDIFFIGQKVIFAGNLEAEDHCISSAECKIVVDGSELGRVKIDGEVYGTGHRDLWTTATVNLKREIVLTRDVWLISL